MSNARKLQTEIDRVMKKVDEGVELFDEIWEKVYSAEQQNQKEKYEMDLKKEIKKLQRLRDQIKTWIGSSDVKDKEPLIEARKLIETKMEQFKICEKETKTKTYSKEGLARQEKLDPAEEAKRATTTWIQEYIDKLQVLTEETDFEIERLSSGKGKKTNKHQIETLNEHISNHRFHISKLEGIIRLVNNDRLEVEPVDDLKEDFDYYLESYEDEDYQMAYDGDMFYESLGLDELDVVNVDHVTQAASSTKKTSDDAASSSSKDKKDKRASKKASVSSVIPLTIGRARSSVAKDKNKDDDIKATPSKAPRASSTASAQAPVAKTPAPSAPAPPAHATSGASMAAILKRETEQQEKERQKLLREQQARAQAEQLRQQQQRQEALRQQESLRQQQQQEAQAQQEAMQRQQQEALRQQQAQQEAAAKQQAAQLQAQQQAAHQKTQKLQNQQLPLQQGGQNNNAIDMLTSGLGGLGLSGDPATGASSGPVGGLSGGSQAPGAGSSYVSALSESFAATPNALDSDRSRQYTPQNPYPTPASYPSTPSTIFDNPAVFEKLGTDCLFFIFYYAQGTYQQYLAARELKKQSWRFHKKYMTWFQRHEEPKITTDEYEQGTYVYFDYETGWCTRIKTDFRFEYSFLEDSLQ